MVASSMLSPAVLPVIDWQATTDSITSSTATSRNPRFIDASPASVMVGMLCGASEALFQPRLARHAACGERQNLEACLRDLLAALPADAVAARVDVREGTIDLFQLARARVHDRRHDLVIVGERRHAERVLDDLAPVIAFTRGARARRNGARQGIALGLQLPLDRSHRCLRVECGLGGTRRRTRASAVQSRQPRVTVGAFRRLMASPGATLGPRV